MQYRENHRVAEHYLDCTVVPDNGRRIIAATVYADAEHTQALGMVQASSADGSRWMISLGEGWITEESDGLHEAIATVARLADERHGLAAQFHRLADALPAEDRREFTGLVDVLAHQCTSLPALRHAASDFQKSLA